MGAETATGPRGTLQCGFVSPPRLQTRARSCKALLTPSRQSLVPIASFVITVAQYRRALCWYKGEIGYIIVGEWADCSIQETVNQLKSSYEMFTDFMVTMATDCEE